MGIASIFAIFSIITASSGAVAASSQENGTSTPSAVIHGVHAGSTDAVLGHDRVVFDGKELSAFVAVFDNVAITAYSSTPEQTDDSPFIMANGKHVYDGAVAANFLPFGTLVRFPDLFGDKVFVVEDRMHKRFSKRMDIWMPKTSDARVFGLKRSRVEILASADIHN